MTKIMEQARAASAERKLLRADFDCQRARKFSERACASAAKMFGDYPDSTVMPDGGCYRGQVKYEDVTIEFSDEGDARSRFFVVKACPQCGNEQNKTLYSLEDLAEVVDSEYVCMKCQLAALGVAPSYLEGLSAGEREMAARLYRVLRETVRRDENEDEKE